MDGQNIAGTGGIIGKHRVFILIKRAAGQPGPPRGLRRRGRFAGEQTPLGLEHTHKNVRQHLLVHQHEVAAFLFVHLSTTHARLCCCEIHYTITVRAIQEIVIRNSAEIWPYFEVICFIRAIASDISRFRFSTVCTKFLSAVRLSSDVFITGRVRLGDLRDILNTKYAELQEALRHV